MPARGCGSISRLLKLSARDTNAECFLFCRLFRHQVWASDVEKGEPVHRSHFLLTTSASQAAFFDRGEAQGPC